MTTQSKLDTSREAVENYLRWAEPHREYAEARAFTDLQVVVRAAFIAGMPRRWRSSAICGRMASARGLSARG